MSSSDEECDCCSVKIYRTNGFWYTYAYDTLNAFVTKLKVELAVKGMNLPVDIEQKLLTDSKDTKWISYEDKFRLLHEFDRFINLELRSRLEQLHIPYNEKDKYVNVVNYAKANNLDLTNKDVLLKDVCVWLGITNWNAVSGGQCRQLQRLKETIKQMAQAAGKMYKKKSRKIYKSRKISKNNMNKLLIGGEPKKKVLIMCQRKTGFEEDWRTDRVEDTIIPKINLVISRLLGNNDDISIVYLSDIGYEYRKGTVDVNCNLDGITACSKEFIAKNRNSFDLIILQTCPFFLMDYHILHNLLKPNGILGVTVFPNGILFQKYGFNNEQHLIPYVPKDLFELETSDDFYISQNILQFRKIQPLVGSNKKKSKRNK